MSLHDIWTPIGISVFAAGAWWGLRRKNRAPTFRLLLALVAGWGIVQITGGAIESLGGWLRSEAMSLIPSPWSELVPWVLGAFFFFSVVLVLVAFHPKDKPGRIEEWLAVTLAAMFLLIGGSL